MGSLDRSKSIGENFRDRVREAPERVAVEQANQRWTYLQLDEASDRVARALLLRRGAGEERVGLALSHGYPAIVGILGVLKAGKTYVPIDVRHPVDRLRHILRDADITAWVTDLHNSAGLRVLAGQLEEPVLLENDALPDCGIETSDVRVTTSAYLLYTSGSTGVPKGILQTHRNVLHYLERHIGYFQLRPGDKYAQVASYGFEAAVKGILAPLLSGATVCPLDLRSVLNWSSICKWVRDTEITIWHSIPSLYRDLMRHADSKIGGSLRAIIVSGEELLSSDIENHFRSAFRTAHLVNLYGLTEASLILLWKVENMDDVPVRLGYPLEESGVVVVCSNGSSARAYEIGEICVESEFVSPGYWRDNALTTANFVRLSDGKLRFHTGDLGRWLADGSIQMCGRRGEQVKISGFRVEPVEIEAALLADPAVKQAVVIARTSEVGRRHLVAYIVTKDGSLAEEDKLRNLLKTKLPDYMTPAVFVTLLDLPRTPSGKVDRNALPAPVRGRQRCLERVAPVTELEVALAAIWAELLKIDLIGVHDNFFELGGDSLMFLHLQSRINKKYELEIELRDFFAAPTIAGIAAEVEKYKRVQQLQSTQHDHAIKTETIQF